MSFQILPIRDITQYFSFSVWLTSLTVTISRFIHVAVNGIISFFFMTNISLGFPSGSAVKNPSTMQETQETWVSSQGQEDPLEEGMATNHSTILAWETRWTEEPGGLQSMGRQRIKHDWSEWARTPKQGNFMNHDKMDPLRALSIMYIKWREMTKTGRKERYLRSLFLVSLVLLVWTVQ